jgi:hypothetical protein
MKYGIGFAPEKTCFLEACTITGLTIRKNAGCQSQTTNIWSKEKT